MHGVHSPTLFLLVIRDKCIVSHKTHDQLLEVKQRTGEPKVLSRVFDVAQFLYQTIQRT